jgi:hypothetical protein
MKLAVALCCSLALSACRQEERTLTDYTEAIEQNATSVADTAVRPAPIVPNPPDTFAVPVPSSTGSIAVTLAPMTPVRLQGTATLKANGWSTIAAVKLHFSAGGGSHEGMIHQGTCQKLGPTVTDLHPISTDSLGVGASATFVDIPLDTLRARPHAIVFGRGARPHTCGQISTAASVTAPAPPVASAVPQSQR